MSLAVGTVVGRNYLAFARVLADSWRQFHPDVPLYVVVADGPHDAPENFHVLSLYDLRIPKPDFFRVRYKRQEVVVTAKAFLLHHLLDLGFERAIFLDADILVLGELSEFVRLLGRHSMVLTPHFTRPAMTSDAAERELNILVSGVYNGGIVGVRDTSAARAYLHWWQDRLYTHCRHDVRNGMHYDQRWLDYAPAFVPDLAVLADTAYNVAYWNLAERRAALDADDTLLIDNRPCRFFHFSGFDPVQPQIVTRYWPKRRVTDLGPVGELFHRYSNLLNAHGHASAYKAEWRFDRFDNGVPVPSIARALHSRLPNADAERWGDPLVTAGDSFFGWLRGPGMPDLWRLVHDSRPDLREAFPEPYDGDRTRFLEWIRTFGVKEYSVPPEFTP